MSSEVQPKWTIAVRFSMPIPARRRPMKYSTALTSWTVTASISASSATEAASKEVTIARRAACCSAVSGPAPGSTDWAVRWISHSTSTWTRSRFSAASERWSTSGATAAR